MLTWYFHYDKAKSDSEGFPHGKLINVKDGQIVDEYVHSCFEFRVNMVTVDTKLALTHRERINYGLSRFVLKITDLRFDIYETPDRIIVIRKEGCMLRRILDYN